jgi:predicted methyltransferase
MILTGCASRPDLSTRLAEGGRSPEDKARDAARRPGSVLEFLGVEAGMTTLDVIASGGYYTEALSEAVGPDGKVYAQNNAFVLQLRDGTNEKAITARLANDRLPNVMRLDRELNDLGIDPGSVDVAITALNFHDIYNGRGVEAAGGVLKAIRGTLADDGVLGLIDHAGNPGNDNEKLHRIEEAKVIETALAAGYRLEATSDVLRNPDDDRTLFVFDPSLQRNTDRFVLKLRKAR